MAGYEDMVADIGNDPEKDHHWSVCAGRLYWVSPHVVIRFSLCMWWYSQRGVLKHMYGQVTSLHWLPVSFRINTKPLTVAGRALPIMALMCLSSCHLLPLMLSTLPMLSVLKGWILVLCGHFALFPHGSFGGAFTFGQILSPPFFKQFLQFWAQMSFQQWYSPCLGQISKRLKTLSLTCLSFEDFS